MDVRDIPGDVIAAGATAEAVAEGVCPICQAGIVTVVGAMFEAAGEVVVFEAVTMDVTTAGVVFESATEDGTSVGCVSLGVVMFKVTTGLVLIK